MPSAFNAIGVVVADMPRSLSFYRQLGLDLPDGADAGPHVEVSLPGGLRLLFDTEDTVRSFDPSWTAATGSSRLGLAFACDSAADVDKVYGELIEAGHHGHLEPWDAVWGQRYAVVTDPDGNHVDLFAPLAEAGQAPG